MGQNSNIQIFLEEGKYTFSRHARERMFERNIDTDQVFNCILSGSVIEEYSDDFPCPSVLSQYKDSSCDLYVVYAICPHYLVVVTAYYASSDYDLPGRIK